MPSYDELKKWEESLKLKEIDLNKREASVFEVFEFKLFWKLIFKARKTNRSARSGTEQVTPRTVNVAVSQTSESADAVDAAKIIVIVKT